MRSVVGLVALLMLLSGCAGSSVPAASPTLTRAPQGSVSIVPTDNSTATGTIGGRVVDVESRPVPEAVVGIVQIAVEVRTTADGLFKFETVPVGKYTLSATALGFYEQTKTVEVITDEEVNAVFELEPLPILDPHQISLPNTFFIHTGAYGSTLVGGETACEACNWNPKMEANPSFAILEIRGKHTVKYPTRPDGLALFIHKNAQQTARAGYIQYCDWINGGVDSKCLQLPMRWTYNETYLNTVLPVDKPTTAFVFNQWCDPFWFCIEERYDEWLTLFYEMPEADVPKDFTAWPPA